MNKRENMVLIPVNCFKKIGGLSKYFESKLLTIPLTYAKKSSTSNRRLYRSMHFPKKGFCVFSVASQIIDHNSTSSRNDLWIGIWSPLLTLVERLYTRLVSSKADVYSPLKSTNINRLFEKPGCPLNRWKHSVYIFAKVFDLPLPVFPNIPIWLANKSFAETYSFSSL